MKKITKSSSIFLSILFSALSIIIFIIIFPKIILYFSSLMGFILDNNNLYTKYIVGTVVRTLGILTIIFIMFKFNLLKNIRFKWKKKYLLFSILFFLYIALNIEFVPINSEKIPLVLLMIISCLGVGIFEEIVIRGLVLGLLLKAWGNSRKGIYFSVLFSSLLFGLGHISNYISGKSELVEALCQIGYALCIGAMLGAILIRCDFSLWWCALLHALYDIANGLGKVASYIPNAVPKVHTVNYSDEILNMLLFLPLLIAGILILIKVKKVDESFNTII
ncbi:MAG TPA: CPBP family intramembrane metalloprotease [Oscillospiraceae bacterium]|nr:CPBP family intramembrane metalloprotease [Oscillospiraceae bacterium]